MSRIALNRPPAVSRNVRADRNRGRDVIEAVDRGNLGAQARGMGTRAESQQRVALNDDPAVVGGRGAVASDVTRQAIRRRVSVMHEAEIVGTAQRHASCRRARRECEERQRSREGADISIQSSLPPMALERANSVMPRARAGQHGSSMGSRISRAGAAFARTFRGRDALREVARSRSAC